MPEILIKPTDGTPDIREQEKGIRGYGNAIAYAKKHPHGKVYRDLYGSYVVYCGKTGRRLATVEGV